jgi:hypothetical protein
VKYKSLKKDFATGFSVSVEADSVDSPSVIYDAWYTCILFNTDDGKFGRVTFDNLDAIRICRGEHCPFDDDWEEGKVFHWVSVVENSSWLIERYAYEKKFYENSYEFGGDVDVMKTDFNHYIFSFHDQFVEVIASGIWVESSNNEFTNGKMIKGHPLFPLDVGDQVDRFIAHELSCLVLKNPLPLSKLIENAKYCTQTSYAFALELEGKPTPDYRLELKFRNDNLISVLNQTYVGEITCFEGAASLDSVMPFIKKIMKEVRQRRKEMGKQNI